MTASKASHKAERASQDTQSGRKSNGLINSDNTDTITPVDNINNLEIVADNVANALKISPHKCQFFKKKIVYMGLEFQVEEVIHLLKINAKQFKI